MNKKNYESPSMSVMELDANFSLLAGSDPIIPSGPGTSVDEGTGAARPYYPTYSIWNFDDEIE